LFFPNLTEKEFLAAEKWPVPIPAPSEEEGWAIAKAEYPNGGILLKIVPEPPKE